MFQATNVNKHMTLEVMFETKSLPTFPTLEGFFPSVYAHVVLQVGRTSEWLTADSTHVLTTTRNKVQQI